MNTDTETRHVVCYKRSYYGPRDEYGELPSPDPERPHDVPPRVCETREEAEEMAEEYRPEGPLYLGHNEYSHGPAVLRVVASCVSSPSKDWGLLPADAEAKACELDPDGDDPETVDRALEACGYILLLVDDEYLFCRENHNG